MILTIYRISVDGLEKYTTNMLWDHVCKCTCTVRQGGWLLIFSIVIEAMHYNKPVNKHT